MPLDNKCRIGPLAGAPPDTCVVVISTRLNRDSSLKMTRLQSVTLQVARGRQNPVDTAYDVSVLADVGFFSRLLMVSLMALDVWKEVSGVESMLATLLVPKWPLSDCTILAIICVPGDVLTLRDGTLTFL
ncbi:hypothetical protein TNCV_4102231 [Trichonephila clavipes]|nr:hypothetical protein TNCV_4102231 [Trichonephila clavipes]